jgi:hypothetical protein
MAVFGMLVVAEGMCSIGCAEVKALMVDAIAQLLLIDGVHWCCVGDGLGQSKSAETDIGG